VVDVAALSRRIDELSAKIRPVLTNDPSVIEYQQQAAEQLRSRIIARVASVREQLSTANEPVKFDSSGSFPLTGWEFRRDSGSPGFSRRGNELHVIASGRPAYGSWRTLVRLDDGEYQLIGKVKLQNAEWGLTFTNKPGAAPAVSKTSSTAGVKFALEYLPISGIWASEALSEPPESSLIAWFIPSI